jgi:acyl-CoA dehydrogenase
MYSFDMTSEQKMLVDTVRRYAEKNLRAVYRDAEEEQVCPGDVVQMGWELGLLPGSIDAEYGGYGEYSALTSALYLEELAWGDLGITPASADARTSLPFPIALRQRQRAEGRVSQPLLRRSIPQSDGGHDRAGDSVRPGGAEDRRRARRAMEFVINGTQDLCAAGQRGRTLPRLRPGKRHTQAFIVPRRHARRQGRQARQADGHAGVGDVRGRTFDEGARAQGQPAGRAEGHPHSEAAHAQPHHAGRAGRGHGARLPTNMRSSTPKSVRPSANPSPTARASPSCWPTCASRSKAHAADGLGSRLQARRRRRRHQAAVLAKNYADKMVLEVTDGAVQVLGGHGYIREHPVELWLRNGRGFATWTAQLIGMTGDDAFRATALLSLSCDWLDGHNTEFCQLCATQSGINSCVRFSGTTERISLKQIWNTPYGD